MNQCKISINDEYNNLALVYKQVKNVEKKHLEKSIPTAGHYFLQNGIHSQKGIINIMID